MTSLKAVIAGKSLIPAGLDKYTRNLLTTLGQEILPTQFVKIPTNFKKVCIPHVTLVFCMKCSYKPCKVHRKQLSARLSF